MRYFMYKYKIPEYDWYESIKIIYKKIENYMVLYFKAEVQCGPVVIRELCESQEYSCARYSVAKSWTFSLKCCV